MRKRPSTRLTKAEISACINALEFVLAGEIDSETEEEAEAYQKAAESASQKLKERLHPDW